MKKITGKFIFIIFLSISGLYLSAAPFFGGFILTDNFFDKNQYYTSNTVSFYIDEKVSDYIRFYTRFTSGLKYFANFGTYYQSNNTWSKPNNGETKNFSIIPFNIDLLYLELKGKYEDPASIKEKDNPYAETYYDLIFFRIGRIQVTQGTGLLFNMKGDGLDMSFTEKNFRFRFFTITNSLDYMPVFDMTDGSSLPVFTNWDKKRYPNISNFSKPGQENGFIGNIESPDYNFFFNSSLKDDYTDKEKDRLNKMRYGAVLAGRIFTGFSFEFMQIFFQNFTINFLSNIDLIPEDYVVTFPTRVAEVYNTFGGRYTSFYFDFNANGKILSGFYYNLEGVYELGLNATYNDLGSKITYQNALINSFAINAGFSFFFNHVTKPAFSINFMCASGDKDVLFKDGTILNLQDQDNNYKSPTSPLIGYVLIPDFSNIITISITQSLKPFAALKSDIFSRFYMENGVILLLRPQLTGGTYISEKADYQKNGSKYSNQEKAFIGVEIDTGIVWQIFSDLTLQLKGGVFIPNYMIYDFDSTNPDDLRKAVLWKVGLTIHISF
jgi:hypothetical protein